MVLRYQKASAIADAGDVVFSAPHVLLRCSGAADVEIKTAAASLYAAVPLGDFNQAPQVLAVTMVVTLLCACAVAVLGRKSQRVEKTATDEKELNASQRVRRRK